MHLLRRCLGLSYRTGYFYGHPGQSLEEIDESVMRGPGYFEKNDKGDTVLIPGVLQPAGARGNKVGAEVEFSEKREGFEAGRVHVLERDCWREAFQSEGDEGAISVRALSGNGCSPGSGTARPAGAGPSRCGVR